MATKKSALKASTRETRQTEARNLSEQVIRKARLAHRWRASDGRTAFEALHQAAYGNANGRDPRKLKLEDATLLASELYRFLKKVAPRLKELGVSRGELCRRAGLCGRAIKDTADTLPEDAKELYRLTLPPGADAQKRGIRVGAKKYLDLIETLTIVLGDSNEAVADQLLRGTSLHPMSRTADEWSDMDLVQMKLQRIVNDLDRDFDLLRTYRRTAELKSKGIAEGGQLGWPLWSVGDDQLSDTPSAEEIDTYRVNRLAAADINQAFYLRNQHYGQRTQGWFLYASETGALQSDEFFYVPHAPLGHVLIWDLPDRREDRVDYELAVKAQVQDAMRKPERLALPVDEWDLEKSCPTGQTGERTRNWELQQFFWLLAYPHPDGKSLVPTLYCAGEEGGAYMAPLNMEVLEMLSDAVWVSPTKHCSVFDRLKEVLLEIGDDDFSAIERNMRRTATWLVENPILKLQHERENISRRLDEVFRTETRPAAHQQSKK